MTDLPECVTALKAPAGLKGDVTPPGDKSISHRALIFASQAVGSTTIQGLLEAEDVIHTAKALQALGTPMERTSTGEWRVHGVGIGGLSESPKVLDLGNSGTGARLLMGLVTPYDFTTYFTGDDSLCRRPMQRVITPLQQMGAQFNSRKGGRMPLAVRGTAPSMPIVYHSPIASAQVKSAILLAALNTPGKTTVTEPQQSRDHTERMLESFGAEVVHGINDEGKFEVTLTGQPEFVSRDRELIVPADPSSAAFLVVAAVITPGSSVLIKQVGMNPLRIGLFTTLKEMGASISYTHARKLGGEEVADIEVRYSPLKGIAVPAERAPSMIDEYPILAVAAAFAKGETRMQGLEELRVKESDRFNAILRGLKACGVDVHAEGDNLIVKGNGEPPRGGATIAGELDHRIAMSFLILGSASEQPVTIDDVRCVRTSFPEFMDIMQDLGARLQREDSLFNTAISTAAPIRPASKPGRKSLVIAIDGPAASGKGSLARRIASQYGYGFLDTGSLYRAVGLRLVYADQSPENISAAVKAARSITSEDLHNPRLRQEHIGHAASVVSAISEVRDALLEYQRNFAARPEGAVLDGRDIGTVVCPKADLKFFITASLEARAKRRHKELQGMGVEVVYDSVMADLRERDQRDRERDCAPLKAAGDAISIDTTHMDADSVFEKVIAIIETKLAEQKQSTESV